MTTSVSKRDIENQSLNKLALKLLAAGLAASIVSVFLNCFDHVKVRLQVQKKPHYAHFVDAFIKISREEGLMVLFGRGLTASVVREMTYSSIRLGLYDKIKALLPLFGNSPGKESLVNKILAAAITGALGSFFVNPCDLIKVRQQAIFPGQPLPYKNFVNAVYRISIDEGIRGLYIGVGPTTVRAAVVTASQLAAYDHTKHILLAKGMKDNFKTHFLASFVASISMAIFSSPVDVIKSRYMADITSGGQKLFKSGLHCTYMTWKTNGFRGFYKGIIPNYFRLFGHCTLCLPLYEKLRVMFGLTTV